MDGITHQKEDACQFQSWSYFYTCNSIALNLIWATVIQFSLHLLRFHRNLFFKSPILEHTLNVINKIMKLTLQAKTAQQLKPCNCLIGSPWNRFSFPTLQWLQQLQPMPRKCCCFPLWNTLMSYCWNTFPIYRHIEKCTFLCRRWRSRLCKS